MAHKKAGGSSKNGRDSKPKYRGIKVYGGGRVVAGNIIVRQKGSKFHVGEGVGQGKDFTLFAKTNGVVHFERLDKKRQKVSIIPA